MSRINGDKARFHRRRKKKIQQRLRQRAMFGALPKQPAGQSPATPSKEQTA